MALLLDTMWSLWIWTYLTLLANYKTGAETIVSVSAPVNPVAEGEILSLYCQVRNLAEGQSVEIFRKTLTKVERLSIKEDVLGYVDNRVFLAHRRASDGSSAYFLSITEVTRHDQGEYFCKVGNDSNFGTLIAKASFDFTVTYFPPKTDPICTPGSLAINEYELDDMELTCSSHVGNPPVTIYWRRYGDKQHLNATLIRTGSRVQSVLKVTPEFYGMKTIFICEIVSKAYPGRNESCKVGPLSLGNVPDEDNVVKVTTGLDERGHQLLSTQYTLSDNDQTVVSKEEFCNDKCFFKQSKYPFWIITTIVTGIIAFIMFCVISILYFKYLRKTDSQRNVSRRQHTDEIYTELEIKRNENSLYMTLPRKEKQTSLT